MAQQPEKCRDKLPITHAASLLGITAERTLERVADILCPGEPLTARGREMAMKELGIIDTLLAAVERLEKVVVEDLCPTYPDGAKVGLPHNPELYEAG